MHRFGPLLPKATMHVARAEWASAKAQDGCYQLEKNFRGKTGGRPPRTIYRACDALSPRVAFGGLKHGTLTDRSTPIFYQYAKHGFRKSIFDRPSRAFLILQIWLGLLWTPNCALYKS
jgi:hypothetical protein